jgi:hypothetical protein
MALPLPVSAGDSGRVPDPIYAAIEAHKAACVVVLAALDRFSVFENELQANRRLRKEDRREDERRRGEEIEAALDQAHDAETNAACVLVDNAPTTMAGVLALLAYASAVGTDGVGWPPELDEDDGDGCAITRSWHFFLVERLVEALPGLVQQGGMV